MTDPGGSIKWLCVVVACVIAGAGCAGPPKSVGYLSDYSRLHRAGPDLRFVDEAKLAGYSQFIVEPVDIHYYKATKGKDTASTTTRKLANHMHSAVVSALAGSYKVVSQPGPGVARVRLALTNIQHDTPALNAVPQTRMTGLGLGGASMEAEMVDSQTGEQIAAVAQTQKGDRLSLDGFSEWSSAKDVMDDWAKRFCDRIDAAHGK